MMRTNWKLPLSNNYIIYLLQCKNNRFYIGITNNLTHRLKMHEIGKGSKFVRAFSPFKLIGIIDGLTKREALQKEYQLKQLPHNEKIKYFKPYNVPVS
jgi:putative endonuclease